MDLTAPFESAEKVCKGCSEWESDHSDMDRTVKFDELMNGWRSGCIYCTTFYSVMSVMIPSRCMTDAYARDSKLRWFMSEPNGTGSMMQYEGSTDIYNVELFTQIGMFACRK